MKGKNDVYELLKKYILEKWSLYELIHDMMMTFVNNIYELFERTN